jgi:hypothetical protein
MEDHSVLSCVHHCYNKRPPQAPDPEHNSFTLVSQNKPICLGTNLIGYITLS